MRRKVVFVFVCGILLFWGGLTAQAENGTVDKKGVIQQNVNQALQTAQNKVVDEATQGIRLTYQALSELRDGKIPEAQSTLADASKALDKATGKGEDLVAVDVFSDIVVGVETVEQAANLMDLAERAISASNPQAARELLAPLVSEIDISETNIPVKAYQDYVNQAIGALDKKDQAQAEEALLSAIGSAVVVTDVLPIPTLLAQADLEQANALVNQDVDAAMAFLSDAKAQLALNNILGYEHNDAFQQQFKSVRKKVLSARHQEVWKDIKEKLGLIKTNSAQNTDQAAAAKVGAAVDKISEKVAGQQKK